MSRKLVLSVPGVSCERCRASITEEVGGVPGVASVDVDLERKRVTVEADLVDEASIRAAIEEAGYEVAGLARATSDGI